MNRAALAAAWDQWDEPDAAALRGSQRRCDRAMEPQRLGNLRTAGLDLSDGAGMTNAFYCYDAAEPEPALGEPSPRTLRIGAIVASLPRALREVFRLVFGEQRSTRDAARLLGTSHMKVHRDAARVVEMVRAELLESA